MAQEAGGAITAPGPAALRLHELATGEEDARLCRDIPEAQCHEQPHNFVHQVRRRR